MGWRGLHWRHPLQLECSPAGVSATPEGGSAGWVRPAPSCPRGWVLWSGSVTLASSLCPRRGPVTLGVWGHYCQSVPLRLLAEMSEYGLAGLVTLTVSVSL